MYASFAKYLIYEIIRSSVIINYKQMGNVTFLSFTSLRVINFLSVSILRKTIFHSEQ